MDSKLKAKIADATKKNAEAGNKDVLATTGGSACMSDDCFFVYYYL
jgi:hypothetical protein